MDILGGKKKITMIVALLLVVAGIFYVSFFRARPSIWNNVERKNTVSLIDNGSELYFLNISSKTVGEFLKEENVVLQERDSVFPGEDQKIAPNMTLYIARAKNVSVSADGETKKYRTQALDVEEALRDGEIILDEDDIVKPARPEEVSPDMKIVVTRVTIEEKIVEKNIPFLKKVNEESALSWRKNIVTVKGEKGIERQTYRVSSYDGKEVNRKLINTEVVKEPVTEVVTQGTYVKLGKSHSGGASWYAWTGTMAAANPWLPLGSYVKVTNTENGKSVIVVINDRGPFVGGRIIDLDKAAFQKIASLGAGVINVKMEEITN